ncbi:hypothetical protein Pelo_17600 [Pelomyxa schiedti]|nr:hypothetical protein Pelo_17600 [Pelomyxa schiedti]
MSSTTMQFNNEAASTATADRIHQLEEQVRSLASRLSAVCREVQNLAAQNAELKTEAANWRDKYSNLQARFSTPAATDDSQKEEKEVSATPMDDSGFSVEDIEAVINQAHVDRATAVTALRAANGDLVEAILSLS